MSKKRDFTVETVSIFFCNWNRKTVSGRFAIII